MTEQNPLIARLKTLQGTQPKIPQSPVNINTTDPNWARVTSYYHSGSNADTSKNHWAVDSNFARNMQRRFPADEAIAVNHRSFQNRAVMYMAGRGIRQFVDVGSGALNEYSAHYIADAWSRDQDPVHASDIKVSYVDNEPVAGAHIEVALEEDGDPDRHIFVSADLRQPYTLWEKVLNAEMIDPEQPVGLLLTATMQQAQLDVAGNEIGSQSLAALRDIVPRGSYLALSHITSGIAESEQTQAEAGTILSGIREAYRSANVCNFVERSVPEVEALMGDYAPVGSGWTTAEAWGQGLRMSSGVDLSPQIMTPPLVWAGVGQKL